MRSPVSLLSALTDAGALRGLAETSVLDSVNGFLVFEKDGLSFRVPIRLSLSLGVIFDCLWFCRVLSGHGVRVKGNIHVTDTNRFMEQAFEEAKAALGRGEVPIGAVVVKEGTVIGRGGNRTRELNDPTAHAEIVAIRQACDALKDERLVDADLYVTLEPCTMCAAAISLSRIRRLYYGAEDAKGGGVDNGVRFYANPTCHHVPEVYSGIREIEAREMLKGFFKERR